MAASAAVPTASACLPGRGAIAPRPGAASVGGVQPVCPTPWMRSRISLLPQSVRDGSGGGGGACRGSLVGRGVMRCGMQWPVYSVKLCRLEPLHAVRCRRMMDQWWNITVVPADKPIGVVFWGSVSDEVSTRLAEGTSKLRPQDWKSGDSLWVVETIAPQPAPAKAGGGAEEMVKDLKAAVFPDREIRMMVVKDGVRDVRAV